MMQVCSMPVLLQIPAKGCRCMGDGFSTLVRECTMGNAPARRLTYTVAVTHEQPAVRHWSVHCPVDTVYHVVK